jgi:hypothetical protein
MHKANKGEWAEFYAFLKILAERVIPLADEDLLEVIGSEITFVKLHRSSAAGNNYIFDLSNLDISILDQTTLTEIISIPTIQISSKLEKVFGEISRGKGAFVLSEAESLSAALGNVLVKAPSTDKADIVGTIRDRNTNTEERSGFSVKSFVGGASTLLNASGATNFIFRVDGMPTDNPADKANEINDIDTTSKIRDRVAAIKEMGASLQFIRVSEPIFDRNLRKIDTMMPEFLAQMLLSFFGGNGNTCVDLTAQLAKPDQPFSNFGLSFEDFAYKIKQLLVSVALGLVPKTPWDGLMKAHGGYLIVKSTGALLCYQAFNRDLFLEYLFTHTKFETPSSTKHKYGSLYQVDGEWFLNLNLQIRF